VDLGIRIANPPASITDAEENTATVTRRRADTCLQHRHLFNEAKAFPSEITAAA
jgi:hypothetical protein